MTTSDAVGPTRGDLSEEVVRIMIPSKVEDVRCEPP